MKKRWILNRVQEDAVEVQDDAVTVQDGGVGWQTVGLGFRKFAVGGSRIGNLGAAYVWVRPLWG